MGVSKEIEVKISPEEWNEVNEMFSSDIKLSDTVEAKQRKAEMDKYDFMQLKLLEQDMIDLSKIMYTLKGLVTEQTPKIENVEKIVESAAVHVKEVQFLLQKLKNINLKPLA